VCRCTAPATAAAVDDKSEDVVAHAGAAAVCDRALAGQLHSGMDHGHIVAQVPDAGFEQLKIRTAEDVLEAVGMRLADRGTVVPPQPDHVDKLGVLVKQAGKLIGIAPVPGFDKGCRHRLRIGQQAGHVSARQ